MTKLTFLFVLALLLGSIYLPAQTIYVDVAKGRYEAKGTITDPFSGLEQAVALASGFSGTEPVTLKVAPGLYVISHILEIRTANKFNDTINFTVEATVMPDDPEAPGRASEGWS